LRRRHHKYPLLQNKNQFRPQFLRYWNACGMEVHMKTTNKEEFEKQNVFGTGNANTAYAQYFIGESFLNPLTKPDTV
jgi:hypothetical protein